MAHRSLENAAALVTYTGLGLGTTVPGQTHLLMPS